MEPTFSVGFECAGEQRMLTLAPDGTAYPADAVAELGVSLIKGSQTGIWRLLAEPTVELAVRAIRAELPVDLRAIDVIYHNGYQSWTDSFERRASWAMPGLLHVPRIVVDDNVLDGSGDYRFTSYKLMPGEQHGFTYCYLRTGERVTLVGSLDEDEGFTTIFSSWGNGSLTLDKEPPAHPLAPGEGYELASFIITSGALGECLESWLSHAGVRPRPARPLIGFTSWYRHYADIDSSVLEHDLAGLARVMEGCDTSGADVTFQIDDGYAKVGDWLEVDAEKFPEGMAPLAVKVSERGFIPGLWLAPFLCERESRLFAEHPGWLLRDEHLGLVATGGNWSGAVALDTQNPEVRAYITRVLQTVVRDWGFKLLKLDFLFAACMLPHAGLNRAQLMVDGLELIREAVGEDAALLLCGVPLASAFGRCEYCRIGCDVGLDWDDVAYMRLLHRERVSTRLSLADTRGRAHLDGLVFGNDPDVFFLRDDVRLSAKQKDLLMKTDAASGSVFLTSDDMGAWDDFQCARYYDVLTTFLRRERR